MNAEIYRLDEQFDKKMRELKKKEEYLEDNLSYVLHTTEAAGQHWNCQRQKPKSEDSKSVVSLTNKEF